MDDLLIIAGTLLAYSPLFLTVLIYAQALRYSYALQIFTDGIRKLGGQVTTTTLIAWLPSVLLASFLQSAESPIDTTKPQIFAALILWLLAYPITFWAYHAFLTCLETQEPYKVHTPAHTRIRTDLRHHLLLIALCLITIISVYPESLSKFVNSTFVNHVKYALIPQQVDSQL